MSNKIESGTANAEIIKKSLFSVTGSLKNISIIIFQDRIGFDYQ